jgi:class 3 adenylate cyclase
VIGVPSRPGAATTSHHGGVARRAERPILHQEVKSMLFADIVGYSRLTEQVIPEFVTGFLDRVSALVATSRHAPRSVNTWGDAVYAVFDFARDAGSFALELTRMIHDHRDEWLRTGLYWEEQQSDGSGPVKHPLNIRVGLHAGPVFLHYDPVVRRLGFTGAHVNRAARIEPVVRAGEVFVSEEFAALAELGNEIDRRGGDHSADRAGFVCEYAGSMPLAKGYPGRFRIYRLRPFRRLEIEEIAQVIHELYCREAVARGEIFETNRALRPWAELRMLGYELTADRGIAASEMALPPELVEAVARHEHRRWMDDRRRQGWTYGSSRDDARKRHPLLVEWEELSETERDKDRHTVRNLPDLVERAGLRLRMLSQELGAA